MKSTLCTLAIPACTASWPPCLSVTLRAQLSPFESSEKERRHRGIRESEAPHRLHRKLEDVPQRMSDHADGPRLPAGKKRMLEGHVP